MRCFREKGSTVIYDPSKSRYSLEKYPFSTKTNIYFFERFCPFNFILKKSQNSDELISTK